MCLIAIAHRVSDRFPLILAANRDEDHARATIAADFWPDAPHVLGGRDALLRGSWLAVTPSRFAAVTNLRGARTRSRSRGALVRAFVIGEDEPRAYGEQIACDAADYAGFHLLAGIIGGDVLYATPEQQTLLAPGIYGISNAPAGEAWPKTQLAVDAMRAAMTHDDAATIADELLAFLAAPRHSGRVESEVFIAGDRYGTRASTVVVASPDAVSFVEQNFAAGGATLGGRREFVIQR
ncbi:MAG: NRDE family protein [Acidobacteria bacterium]|nr:NRDE family protein [Acidobacteriota bacterium]MBV9477972.1 NRDE family protein [Acidobacteriota bacterium]